MNVSSEPRRADLLERAPVRFSICTLVTDQHEYDEMVTSFRIRGFDGTDCEYLFLDNSEANAFDGYRGYNLFLREAAGDFIILCHQDVVLLQDDRDVLEARLAELESLDPHWALCGNSGGTASGELVMRISDPHESDRTWGALPARVTALDENFIVVRRDANLALSHDLSGFHLYGADLCIVADVLGRSAWVIDFHLLHKSPGRYEPAFFAAVDAVQDKYRRAFSARVVTTSCTHFLAGGSKLRSAISRLFTK